MLLLLMYFWHIGPRFIFFYIFILMRHPTAIQRHVKNGQNLKLYTFPRCLLYVGQKQKTEVNISISTVQTNQK